MRHLLTVFGLVLAATPLAADTLQDIRERGVITLGVREDARPLSYFSDGEPRGFTVDLCLGVMDYLDKEIGPISPRFVAVTAENRFDMLADGEIDMLCGAASMTLRRRALVDFSIPIFIDGASVLMRAGSSTDFANLNGKSIGVRAGTTTADALANTLAQQGLEAEVVLVDDHHEGLDGVLDERFAAYFADQSILFGLRSESGRADELVVARNALTVEPQAIALPRGDTAFRLAVDTAISRMYRTGAVVRMFADNFAPAEMGQAMRAMVLLAPIPE